MNVSKEKYIRHIVVSKAGTKHGQAGVNLHLPTMLPVLHPLSRSSHSSRYAGEQGLTLVHLGGLV